MRHKCNTAQIAVVNIIQTTVNVEIADVVGTTI